VLRGLTQLEEMLIARINPIMTVYTVRGGQRKGSKYIYNFFQNVDRIASVLPHLPTPDHIPLMVRRSSADGTNHYDFRVRRHKVIAALRWLKVHHRWYHDITIYEERLLQLPED
jgi:hypothetical protein